MQAYNFRLCVTQDPTNTIPFPKPANYDPAEWELLRRDRSALFAWLNSEDDPDATELQRRNRAALKVSLGLTSSNNDTSGSPRPSCNTQPLPPNGLKYDMNNCGGIASDLIGGSWAYPEVEFYYHNFQFLRWQAQ